MRPKSLITSASLTSISRQARSFYSPGIKVKRAEYRPTLHYFHTTTLRSLVPKLLTMAKGGTLWGWQRRIPYKSINCQLGKMLFWFAPVAGDYACGRPGIVMSLARASDITIPGRPHA